MKKNRFGLIGKNISYSFSRGYFAEKFENLKLEDCSYENFDLQSIEEFEQLLTINKNVKGLNVTIPYKQEILPYLDKIEKTALAIGAVNTIKIKKSSLVGFNTDVIGFQKSLEPHLQQSHKKALILGTGGASKAVAHVLNSLAIHFQFVSRNPAVNQYCYADLNHKIIEENTLIINCTPLGTYPDIEKLAPIPYEYITEDHLLYDLIYNPSKTAFLKAGEAKGATVINGLKMLELQAEAAWDIWNS